jgi:hypothetical protein
MTFDNATLVGVLFTLPYIVLLLMFGRNWSTRKHEKEQLFDFLEKETCRYGT